MMTKMLAIEDEKTSFEELEMYEFDMRGSAGFSIIGKAERT